jgi:probable phosphoglycerate mutase
LTSEPLRAPPLKPGLTLYLIRHGETDWNREARYQGQRDVPLNETGRAQALRHGKVLKPLLPALTNFDFVSSPLCRAVETMRVIRTALGLDADSFRTDTQIIELSYGYWEGQLAAELPKADPRGLSGKMSDPFGWRPKDGESYRDLEERVSVWLRTLEKDTIAVTHGGVSRVARGAILGIDDARVPFLDVPQDKILKLRDATMSWL